MSSSPAQGLFRLFRLISLQHYTTSRIPYPRFEPKEGVSATPPKSFSPSPSPQAAPRHRIHGLADAVREASTHAADAVLEASTHAADAPYLMLCRPLMRTATHWVQSG